MFYRMKWNVMYRLVQEAKLEVREKAQWLTTQCSCRGEWFDSQNPHEFS